MLLPIHSAGSDVSYAGSEKEQQFQELELYRKTLKDALPNESEISAATIKSCASLLINRLDILLARAWLDAATLTVNLETIYELIGYYFVAAQKAKSDEQLHIELQNNLEELLYVELPRLTAVLSPIDFLNYLRKIGDLQLKHQELADFHSPRGALFTFKKGLDFLRSRNASFAPIDLENFKKGFLKRLDLVEVAIDVDLFQQRLDELEDLGEKLTD